mgnify:CR=1 FL=1
MRYPLKINELHQVNHVLISRIKQMNSMSEFNTIEVLNTGSNFDPKDKENQNETQESSDWDHEKDNCGINPDKNPCGDANEY